MKKNVINILILTTIFSSPVSAFAENNNLDNEKEILLTHGVNFNIVDVMDDHDILDLSKSISENPDNVSIENSILTTDNISFIEDFVSKSDDELLDLGFSEDEINTIDKDLAELKEMTIEDIEDIENLSSTEYHVIQELLEEDFEDFETIPEDEKVTSSGTISTSTLSYTMMRTNKSTSTQPIYDITGVFDWKQSYFMFGKTDSIAFAWGGNFNNRNTSSNLTYGVKTTSNGWAPNTRVKVNTLKNQKASAKDYPNSGLVFNFPQSKNMLTDSWRVRSGTVKTQLFQTKKYGNSAKITSQYAHAKVGASGVSISSKGLPGISFGGSYDTSPQRATNVIN